MDITDLSEIELQLICYDEATYPNDICSKYSAFLQAVCKGDFESALSNTVSEEVLQLNAIDLSCISADSLQSALCQSIQKFLYAETEPENRVRQLVAMGVGVSCLQLFVQNNWVGPPAARVLLVVNKSFDDKCSALNEAICGGLAVEDESIHHLSRHPLYLFVSKMILCDCRDSISWCQTSGLWLLRFVKILQSLYEERSSKLKDVVLKTLKDLSSAPLFNSSDPRTSSLRIQFHLEAGHLCYFYYESSMAHEHFAAAERLSQLSVQLTGMLGKRTRFQERDISQLVLDVQLLSTDSQQLTDHGHYSSTRFPKSIKLDDEAVLEDFNLKDPEMANLAVNVTPVQQAMILGLCHNHRKTHESEGQSKIVQEEAMAFINSVLSRSRCWSVQTMALLLRSRWEKDSSRRIQRSMSQIEELVKQFSRKDLEGHCRLPLVYAVSLPPIWILQQELGRLYDEIGAVSSALDVYLQLECWVEVIGCYTKLGLREKAEKLIREQLALKETPNLWCYLGDVTSDPEHYHSALKLSKGRSSRSLRSLAYHHFNKRDMEQALVYFDKSLQISPLQVGVWFTYGCAALECEQYELAATAFRRCVNLDSDNFAAWNNLATSYIKACNKPRAFLTYQEALKCDYENWRVWENYLAVATDIGEFDEAIKAYHRLLELRNKHTDVAVLRVLVRAVVEKLTDASGEPAEKLKPKLLKLFGRVTASVTNCSEIWTQYAKLLIACDGGADDKTTVDRSLQCLKSAHSCATLQVNWEKDAVKCVEICQLSHHLAAVYLECYARNKTSLDADRIKSSGKLMVKGVIAKIRKQFNDTPLPTELAENLQLLENDFLSFNNATSVET